MKTFAFVIAAGLGVAACQTTTGEATAESAEAPGWTPIVGRTLVNTETNFKVVLNPNGTIEGEGIEGVWTERDGKYCRTLTKPTRMAGTECQTVTVDGNQVTLDNQQGRVTTWIVQ